MTQYGFFFDQSRCIGCSACTIACKQWHDVPGASEKWMRVYQWEKGAYPDTRLIFLAISCYHCQNPVCVKACSRGALYKEERYGAVLLDADRCRGDRKCWKACPYGAPQYSGDAPGLKMSKCNMCIDRLGQGLKPICVMSCSMRAWEFGPLEELARKYGNLKTLEDLPRDSITRPSVVFRPPQARKPVLPWDSEKALALWQKRETQGEPLPDIFESMTEVTGVPREIVGRNRLVLKPKNSDELIYFTTDND